MTKIFFPVDDSIPESSVLLAPAPEVAFDLINQWGLSRKHIMAGVANSFKRLGTYIDVPQIHIFDPDTPIRKTMKALNDVKEKGNVRYVGASSMLPTQFAEI